MELRRRHRIIYQTKIRLRAPDRDHSVVARVQNLSPRGVFVTAADIPAAGTELQCRLTLAGEQRTLRGRVAWVRPASSSTSLPQISAGAGIEFLDLEEPDRQLLHRLVAPAEERGETSPSAALPLQSASDQDSPVELPVEVPVDVWFEGRKASVRCRAILTDTGLRLSTRLPFMRLGSAVAVRYLDQDRPAHGGFIDSIALEPGEDAGVPRLELNVALEPPDAVEGIIEVTGAMPRAYESAPRAASTVVDPSLSSPPPPHRDPTSIAEQTVRIGPTAKLLAMWRARSAARLRRVRRWLRRSWPPLAAGFFTGTLLTAILLTQRPLRGEMHAPQRPAIGAGPARQAPAPVAKAPTSMAEVPAPPAPAPVAEAPAPAATAEPEIGAPNNSAEAAAFGLGREGSAVTLMVPLLGSGKGSEQYRLAEPPGVAITLPKGRPRIATGVYRPDGGPVRVQVRRRAPGSHVRFFYDPVKYRGTLSVRGDALVLELEER